MGEAAASDWPQGSHRGHTRPCDRRLCGQPPSAGEPALRSSPAGSSGRGQLSTRPAPADLQGVTGAGERIDCRAPLVVGPGSGQLGRGIRLRESPFAPPDHVVGRGLWAGQSGPTGDSLQDRQRSAAIPLRWNPWRCGAGSGRSPPSSLRASARPLAEITHGRPVSAGLAGRRNRKPGTALCDDREIWVPARGVEPRLPP